MTRDEAAAGDSITSATGNGSLPFDISVAHQARMYNYVLGGKDHIVAIEDWRPGSGKAGRSSLWCAVGRKR